MPSTEELIKRSILTAAGFSIGVLIGAWKLDMAQAERDAAQQELIKFRSEAFKRDYVEYRPSGLDSNPIIVWKTVKRRF